jgi:hypothetical protein
MLAKITKFVEDIELYFCEVTYSMYDIYLKKFWTDNMPIILRAI